MLAVMMLALCKFYFQEDSQLCLVAEVPSWPLSLHVTQHLLVNRHGVALGLLGCCIRSPANAFPKHIIHDNTPTLTRNSFPKALDTARLGCCMSWWNNPHQGMMRSIRICLFRNLTYFSSTPCFPDCGHLLRSYIEQLYFLHRFCADRIYAAFSMSGWGAHGVAPGVFGCSIHPHLMNLNMVTRHY